MGITLIGIISGAYGGTALSDDMREVLSKVSFLAPYADTLAIILVIGSITYFSIVIGELIPKSLALGNAENIALFVAPIIQIFTTLTLPLVKILSISTNAIIRLLSIKESPEEKFPRMRFTKSLEPPASREYYAGMRPKCTKIFFIILVKELEV
ncbi:DUF21 domain-containing protein [Adhaeribacter radiodurans]|uniref:DUF21 domain-containing protein n=1 Tax=Adhaeribacter radiodurans TaxID=2745197 RepID=A0A7L7L504_9BACT|nr:DUF21 domain-containing protein [Adhaeribacter radiodurans]